MTNKVDKAFQSTYQRKEYYMFGIADFLTGSSWLVYAFIFVGKLVEVALASLRSQLILKGQRLLGFFVAIFEYTFWLSITASALSGFQDDPLKIVLLILAFASGNVLGSLIEEKLALGYSTVTSFYTNREDVMLAADKLRSMGYALTILPSEGISGDQRYTMITSVDRKHTAEVEKVLYQLVPNVVLTIAATQHIKGFVNHTVKKK